MGWQQPDELPTTLSTLMAKAMNDQPIQPGEGVLHHDPKGKVAEAYKSLAKEVLADADRQRKLSSERAR